MMEVSIVETSKKFTGYTVAVGVSLTIFVTTGALGTFGVFLPHIVKDLGFPVAAVAFMATCASTFCFLTNSIMSKVIDRIGPKLTMLIGALLCALHYVIYGSATSLPIIYIGGAMGGISMGLATSAMASIVLTRWFVAKREVVIGTVMATIGFGGSAFAFIAGQSIAAFGWRSAYYIIAAIIAIITVPVILILVKDSPEKIGQLPLGADSAVVVEKKVKEKGVPEAKTPCFWMVYIGMFFIGSLSPSIKFFMTSCWQGYGMDPVVSANYLSLALLLGAVGFPLAGGIAQKIGTRRTLTFLVAVFCLCMLFMYLSSSLNPVYIVLAAVCYALSFPSQHLTSSLTTMEAFGPKAYGRLLGVFHGGAMFSSAFTSLIIGALKDATGSYTPALILLSITAVVSLIFLLIGFKLSPVEKERQLNANANANV